MTSGRSAQRLAGEVALVTGSGRGIGRAIASGLAEAGASVALCSRSSEQLEEAAATIERSGGRAAPFPADVAADGVPESLVEDVERTLGPLSVLVNAAGISPVYTRAERIAVEDFDAIVRTNLRAPFLLSQAAGRRMLERGAGSIVNIASVGGIVALPRLAAYSTAKAGLVGMTRVMAVEWAPGGVRVNAVAPAYSETELSSGLTSHPTLGPQLLANTPLGRFADTAEIARVVVFLASAEASYVTGQTICVDGGWTAQ